ncbi:YceI family protein, partial [Larkinella soli]|uniref:YceI family protein n=1 Tax=Larkinella soli TaxID=1770527 RepID=UPI0013E3ABF4
KEGRNRYTGWFQLTIKGITRDVMIPFTRIRLRSAVRYQGRFTLNRLDFGVGESSMLLDRDVTVSIRLQVPEG